MPKSKLEISWAAATSLETKTIQQLRTKGAPIKAAEIASVAWIEEGAEADVSSMTYRKKWRKEYRISVSV